MKNFRQDFESDAPAEDINISPLIDVIFILLIFFLVTMVFVDKRSLEVDVPDAENAAERPQEFSSVAISADGALFFNSRRCTLETLPQLIKSSGVCSVMLSADKSARAETVVAVVDAAKGAGAKSIYLATSKK